jgi:hypothetical protein
MAPNAYHAGHWRQGGLQKEAVLTRSTQHSGYAELQYTRLRTIMSVDDCGSRLMRQMGYASLQDKPGLLVTDNSVVRGWVSSGALRNWVAHNTTVVHIKGAKVSDSAHEDMWVDVMMLAMGDCFVLSSSGFSQVALWMSNATCVMRMLNCQQDAEPRFAGIEV